MKELRDTCPWVIMICEGSKCSRLQKDLRRTFKHELKERGLKREVEMVEMDCTSRCKQGPVVCIQPANLWLGEVRDANVPQIIDEMFREEPVQ